MPTISSSVAFSPSIFPSIWVFSNCWLFASDGQSIGASASASVRPVNIQTLLINPGYTPRAANRCDPDVSGSAFNLPHTFTPSLLPTLNFQSSALLAQVCPQPTLGLGALPWSFWRLHLNFPLRVLWACFPGPQRPCGPMEKQSPFLPTSSNHSSDAPPGLPPKE